MSSSRSLQYTNRPYYNKKENDSAPWMLYLPPPISMPIFLLFESSMFFFPPQNKLFFFFYFSKRHFTKTFYLLKVKKEKRKSWLILKLNVGICCYSKAGPCVPVVAMLSAPPPACCKWRQAVVKWEMQNSQSVCLFNVSGSISCKERDHSALSDGRHSSTHESLMTHFTSALWISF